MKRRKFLTLAGIGTAVAALPAVGLTSNAFFKQAISKIIYRDLHYLNLNKEGVAKFAEDFSAYINSRSFTHSQKVRMKVTSEYMVPGSLDRAEVVDYITSNYLKASDFFMNQMDESKEVKYVGLFDSYKRPCANPFSHLYYPSTTPA